MLETFIFCTKINAVVRASHLVNFDEVAVVGLHDFESNDLFSEAVQLLFLLFFLALNLLDVFYGLLEDGGLTHLCTKEKNEGMSSKNFLFLFRTADDMNVHLESSCLGIPSYGLCIYQPKWGRQLLSPLKGKKVTIGYLKGTSGRLRAESGFLNI